MRVTSCALVLALAVAGCATADDRDQARGVVQRFYHALEEGRGRDACTDLSAATVSQLEGQSGRRCARVVTRLDLEGGEVTRTEVFVTNAKVDLSSGESAFLGREPTGWKLSAIGCRPEQGKPQHRPLECEVES
jgi:hypothetical protein